MVHLLLRQVVLFWIFISRKIFCQLIIYKIQMWGDVERVCNLHQQTNVTLSFPTHPNGALLHRDCGGHCDVQEASLR